MKSRFRPLTAGLLSLCVAGTASAALEMAQESVSYSEAGGFADVTVVRTTSSVGEVSVSYETFERASDTAEASKDYLNTAGTLTWSDGDASAKTIQVPLVDNTEATGDRTFVVDLFNAIGTTIGDKRSVVRIIEDDVAGGPTLNAGELRFNTAFYSVSEATPTLTVSVSRVNGTDGRVGVFVETSPNTATANEDYVPVSKNVIWNDGEGGLKHVTITLTDDLLVEGREILFAELQSPSVLDGSNVSAPAVVYPTSAEITLLDNDSAGSSGTAEIGFSKIGSTVSEGGTVTAFIERDGDFAESVSVRVKTIDVSTSENTDYDPINQLITWAAEDADVKTISVNTTDNNVVDGNLGFALTLEAVGSNPPTITEPRFDVTILDDDAESVGVVSMSDATVFVSESGGSVQLGVVRSEGGSGAAQVTVRTINGTADNGDFTPVFEQLSWADGEVGERLVSLNITDNAVDDSDRDLSFAIVAAKGVELGDLTNTVVNIIDDEASSPGNIDLTAASIAVSQSVGSVRVLIARSGGSTGEVAVSYATQNGTAIAGTHYEAVQGEVSWGDGEVGQKTVLVPITPDSGESTAKSFKFLLESATNSALIGTSQTNINIRGEVQVTDPVPGKIYFTETSVTASEGDGTVGVRLGRRSGSDGEITAFIRTNEGTARESTHYRGGLQEVTWADGDAGEKTLVFALVENGIIESSGVTQFEVEVIEVTDGDNEALPLPSPATQEVRIFDNDREVNTVTFLDEALSVAEGNSTLQVPLSRLDGASNQISAQVNFYGAGSGEIDCRSDDGSGALVSGANLTAVAGQDFTAPTGGALSVTWAAGDTGIKTFAVDLLQNDNDTSNKLALAQIFARTTGTLIGTRCVYVSIQNSTAIAGNVGYAAFALDSERYQESSGLKTIYVARRGGSSGALSAQVSFGIDGNFSTDDATNGNEYNADTTIVSWADGETEAKPVVMEIRASSGNRVASLKLTDLQTNAEIDTLDVTIVDATASSGFALEFEQDRYALIPNSSLRACFVRVGSTEAVNVSVSASTSFGAEVPTNISLAKGQTRGCLLLFGPDDAFGSERSFGLGLLVNGQAYASTQIEIKFGETLSAGGGAITAPALFFLLLAGLGAFYRKK